MRILWWLFLPCAYFLFCVVLMKILWWASDHDETLDGGWRHEDVQ
jgi:hypothetical protein